MEVVLVLAPSRGIVRNFLRGDKRGGLRDGSLQRGPGAEPRRGYVAKPPEARDIYRMHNKENEQKYTTLLIFFACFLCYAFSITQRKLT